MCLLGINLQWNRRWDSGNVCSNKKPSQSPSHFPHILDVDVLILVRVIRFSKQFVELLAPLSLIFFASACSKVCFLLSSMSVKFETSPTNLDPKHWLFNVLDPECSILSRTRTSFGFVSLI